MTLKFPAKAFDGTPTKVKEDVCWRGECPTCGRFTLITVKSDMPLQSDYQWVCSICGDRGEFNEVIDVPEEIMPLPVLEPPPLPNRNPIKRIRERGNSRERVKNLLVEIRKEEQKIAENLKNKEIASEKKVSTRKKRSFLQKIGWEKDS